MEKSSAVSDDIHEHDGPRSSLAVIIVNYRTADLALASARSAARSSINFRDLNIVLVDGGSDDGSKEIIAASLEARSDSAIRLLALPVNGGFAFANNEGIISLERAGIHSEFIALVNPDARVRTGALEAMASLRRRERRAGAVGALLQHEDGRPQASAFNFPSLLGEFSRGARTGIIDKVFRVPAIAIEPDRATPVPWVAGTAVMFRREALEEVGLFDEGFFLYFEETELMRRIRDHGWEIWHEPAARVVHYGGVATQIRDPETGRPRRNKPLPRYWYESRRRYFALVGGFTFVLASGAAWLGGRSIWLLRRWITCVPDDGAQRMTRDFIRFALWPRRRDTRSHARSLNSLPSEDPAWRNDL